jgi:hypothetical protein
MRVRTPGQAPARHRLLPHERWLADYGARKGPAPEGSDRRRPQQNYGPDGMALLVAGSVDATLGGLVVMTGLADLCRGPLNCSPGEQRPDQLSACADPAPQLVPTWSPFRTRAAAAFGGLGARLSAARRDLSPDHARPS